MKLFDVFRQTSLSKNVIEVFTNLYDFAAATMGGIGSRSPEILRKRWHALRKQANRESGLMLWFKGSAIQAALEDQNLVEQPLAEFRGVPHDDAEVQFSREIEKMT